MSKNVNYLVQYFSLCGGSIQNLFRSPAVVTETQEWLEESESEDGDEDEEGKAAEDEDEEEESSEEDEEEESDDEGGKT